jgi:hypothetical protein
VDPQLYTLLEPAVVLFTLLGVAFGVKLLVWGKGPIKQIRRAGVDPAAAERIVELEERLRELSDVVLDQSHRLEDHDERLDFAERLLTKRRDEEVLPPGNAGPQEE